MKRAFGTPDPLQDARRVRTAQLLGGGAAGGGVILPSSLENKIYLWPADGGAISTYDPNQAGLIAALAAAASGDTVWLPSITISCTSAKTIPADVALAGISHNAILSFSGFHGAAIVMSAGSYLFGFSVVYVATGIDAVGIDNQQPDTRVEHMDVQVSGGTLVNIRIGRTTIAGANEVWGVYHESGIGHTLAWSGDFDFLTTGNSATWHMYQSWPGTFDGPDPQKAAFNPDGSEFYIKQSTSIWRCTNQAAIRATPSTLPTWDQILSSGTTIDSSYHPISINAMAFWNDRLCAVVRTNRPGLYYGEYLSGVWTFDYMDIDHTGAYQVTHEYGTTLAGVALDYMDIYNPLTLGVYAALYCGFDGASRQPIWRNFDPATSQAFTVWRANGVSARLVNKSGTVLHDTGVSNQDADYVTGALLGPAVFVVMHTGELFVSEDGTTFTQRATGLGIIHDAIKQGGGSLIKMYGAASGSPVIALSLDRGATWNNKTGDFWSHTSATGLAIVAGELIYG